MKTDTRWEMNRAMRKKRKGLILIFCALELLERRINLEISFNSSHKPYVLFKSETLIWQADNPP